MGDGGRSAALPGAVVVDAVCGSGFVAGAAGKHSCPARHLRSAGGTRRRVRRRRARRRLERRSSRARRDACARRRLRAVRRTLLTLQVTRRRPPTARLPFGRRLGADVRARILSDGERDGFRGRGAFLDCPGDRLSRGRRTARARGGVRRGVRRLRRRPAPGARDDSAARLGEAVLHSTAERARNPIPPATMATTTSGGNGRDDGCDGPAKASGGTSGGASGGTAAARAARGRRRSSGGTSGGTSGEGGGDRERTGAAATVEVAMGVAADKEASATTGAWAAAVVVKVAGRRRRRQRWRGRRWHRTN